MTICQPIEALYSELSLKGIADRVKFVIVAKTAPGFSSADFDSFFTRLSVNCLAISFSDSKSHDKIFKAFRVCTDESSNLLDVPLLVVHPNGKALQFDPYFLGEYEAQSFPFTEDYFNYIVSKDDIMRSRIRSTESPIFLEELVQCGYLSRIASEDDYIPTSDLNDTVVALYLCYNGHFMAKLQDIHQKCYDQGLEFEVVLVPLPFDNHYETPSFRGLMKQLAMKHSRSSSWWTFPFDDKLYRTLWRLVYSATEDHLIILPRPGGCLGDLWGKEMAAFYGMEAYPFTRDVIVSKHVSELRSFNLQQLLGNVNNIHMSSHLQNKNVLLYFDYPTLDSDLYTTLKQNYDEIKEKYQGSEVVFVPLEHGGLGSEENKQMSEMKWPILPPEMCASVIEYVFPYRYVGHPTLVSFGRDGKVLSLTPELQLPISTSPASLFDDTLAFDIETAIKSDIM